MWVFANGGDLLYLEDYEYRKGSLVPLDADVEPHERLMFAFRVKQKLYFNDYYNDPHFAPKKRIPLQNPAMEYGDNHLHDPVGRLFFSDEIQGPPAHVEVPCDAVLISAESEFYYFGCFAPHILSKLKKFFPDREGTKSFPPDIGARIIDAIHQVCPKPGFYGFPSFKNHPDYRADAQNEDYLRYIYQNCLDAGVHNGVALLDRAGKIFHNSTINAAIH